MLLGPLLSLGRFADFASRAVAAAPLAVVRRPGDVLRQFERVAWGSLPIIAAAGLSIGIVTWLQTRRLLLRYGVEATLPSVLAAAVLVETGPMLAGVLVAARLGAGLAAELSSKVLTEEVDAAEVLGAPAIPTLAAPRVVACTLAVPLLTIVLDAAALAGGLFAELAGGSLSITAYGSRCLDYLRLADVIPGTLKTAVFGLIVGLVGCWVGLRSGPSTEAIGNAATRGVVGSILLIFASNVLLVPAIQWVAAVSGWSG